MRYALLSFLCVITVIAYIQRSAFNGCTQTIERDLALGPKDMGLVMGAWYLAYAVFQVPSGLVAERLGSKTALLLFASFWSVCTGLVGLALGFPGLLLIWMLMGTAMAGIFPCCFKVIGATFSKTEQAFASGLLACCMSLGAALAPAITAQLIDDFSWQYIFTLYAFPGLLWALAFWLVIPRPDAPAIPAPPDPGDESDGWHALPPQHDERGRRLVSAPPIRWSKFVTDRQMLLLCLQQFLRAGPMALFFTWFARVLMETRGLSAAEASGLASWPPLVGALGGAVGGLASDYLLRRTGNARIARQGMTFVLLVVGAATSLAAFLTASPHVTVVLMSVAAFCGQAGGVSGFSLAITYGGKRVATVFAAVNMSGNIGASLFSHAVGRVAGATGNWNYPLLMFAAMFLVGAACWAVLNPRGTLFEEAGEKAN